MGIDNEVICKEDQHLVEEFECIVCRMLAEDPKQCQQCRKYFCEQCITEWQNKNKICPIKCSEQNIVVISLKEEDMARYLSVKLKCDRGCNKYYPLSDYMEHLAVCQLPDCSEKCQKNIRYSYEGKEVCSYNCLMIKYPEMKEDPLLQAETIMKTYPDIDLKKNFPLIWDVKKSSNEITITGLNTFLSTSMDDNFHTVVSKVGLIGGQHRFEMDIAKSLYPMKIGVTKNPDTPSYRQAFCDFESGYGIFTIGQTRNDSNYSGLLFAERLDKNVPHKIKMEICMAEGKLKFIIDDKNHGAAFQENALSPVR